MLSSTLNVGAVNSCPGACSLTAAPFKVERENSASFTQGDGQQLFSSPKNSICPLQSGAKFVVFFTSIADGNTPVSFYIHSIILTSLLPFGFEGL